MNRRRKSEPLTLDQVQAAAAAGTGVPWATRRSPGSASDLANVSAFLRHAASRLPEQPAVHAATRDVSGRATWTHLTFRALREDADRVSAGLVLAGLRRGDRVAVLLPETLDAVVVAFALLQAGAVPLLVQDLAANPRRMAAALAQVRPTGVVAGPLGLALSVVLRRAFGAVRLRVAAGPWLPTAVPFGAVSLRALLSAEWRPFEPAPTSTHDDALALFTNPPSGMPRLVVHDHGTLIAQLDALRGDLGLRESESVVTSSLGAALAAIALGQTAVLCPAGPALRKAGSRPAERLIDAVSGHAATTVFGTPATWRAVAEHCLAHSQVLSSVRRVVLAGAPATPATLEIIAAAMPSAGVQVIHGAAEAFPVAMTTHAEVLGETRAVTDRGGGVCLGRPSSGVEVCVLRLLERPPAEWHEDLVEPPGVVGEILVRGPVVARRHRSHATRDAQADLHAPDEPWHRLGDLGWVDRSGRIWSCGRKADVVPTRFGPIYPEACEPLFDGHPRIGRALLTGVGESTREEPVLLVTARGGTTAQDEADRVKAQAEILATCERHEPTRGIKRVLFVKDLPAAGGRGRPDRQQAKALAERMVLGRARS